MLVLTRTEGEKIVISHPDGEIIAEVAITKIDGTRVRLGILADPTKVGVDRENIYYAKQGYETPEEFRPDSS
jgi:sRNA-binding carbon storage regulator CsrA